MKNYTNQRKKIFASSSVATLWGGRAAPLVFFVFSVVLLVMSSLNSSLMESARTGVADVSAPLLNVVSTPFNKIADFTGDITGMAELRAENTKLLEDNKRLNAWYQTALQLEAENSSLKEILNVKIDPKHSFITARIYADAGNIYVHSYLVGVGANDGVTKGQAVLGEKGLIGRIVEVGNKTARVLLLNDMNSRIPVLIDGSNQRAILTGSNEKLPYLRHLPVGSEVEKNSRIVTSGHGGIFPPGLPVGIVENPVNGRIYVTPYGNLKSVRFVRIVNIPEIPNLITIANEKELP